MPLKRFHFVTAIFCALPWFIANAVEDAAELHNKGIAALKDSQTNPEAIVAAARHFAKAAAQYEAAGKTELAVEMNSYLYWCKKKMSMKDIDAFLKSEDATVAARLSAIEKKSVVPADGQAWLDRADAFARANPDDHFLIAVRYYEVAGRFMGTEVSLVAQERSLQEVQLAMSARTAPKAQANSNKSTGLSWLVSQQEPDGHWDAKKNGAERENDMAVTSLALLALQGAGHSDKAGEYRDSVKRALKWLRAKASALDLSKRTTDQTDADGYGAVLMAIALTESAATGGTEETKIAAQKAIDFCTRVYPISKGVDGASFRVATSASTPLVGWCVMAMKSATVARLQIDTAAFTAASEFLDSVEHVPVGSYWNKPDEKIASRQTPQLLSAVGASARMFLGKKGADLRPTVDYFLKLNGVPAWRANDDSVDLSCWYFASQAILQTDEATFREWSDAMTKALLQRQQPDGQFNGSRPLSGFASREWGRVGQTALACLCLEVVARFDQLSPPKRTVNLLELIDPRKGKLTGRGKWQVFGDHLSSDNGVRGVVQIPYHPPEEYDFNVEFSMQQSRLVVFVLPGPNTQFEYGIGFNTTSAGFEMVSGKRSDANETTRPFRIEANRKYKTTIKVRKTGVAAYIDDKLMSELKTDFSNLSVHEHWIIPDKRAFAITNDLVVTTYHSISVTEITGRGEVVSKP